MQFLPSEGVEMVVVDLSKGSSFDLTQNLETEAAQRSTPLATCSLAIYSSFLISPMATFPDSRLVSSPLATSHAKPFPACARKFRHLP
jgi:hypothetical protein